MGSVKQRKGVLPCGSLDHDNERRDTKGYLQKHGSYNIVCDFTPSDFGTAGYPAFERQRHKRISHASKLARTGIVTAISLTMVLSEIAVISPIERVVSVIAWFRQVSATILAETQHKSQTSSANALGSHNAS